MALRVRTVRDLDEFAPAIGGDRPLLRLGSRRRTTPERFVEAPAVRPDARRLRRGRTWSRARASSRSADRARRRSPVRRRDRRRRPPVAPAPRAAAPDDGRRSSGTSASAERPSRRSGPPRRRSTAGSATGSRRSAGSTSRPTAATRSVRPELPRGRSLRLVAHDEALRALPRIYGGSATGRRASISRSRDWWKPAGSTIDPQSVAGPGRSSVRCSSATGARWATRSTGSRRTGRRSPSWRKTDPGPRGRGASTKPRRADLWRFLLEIDWTDVVRAAAASRRPSAAAARRPGQRARAAASRTGCGSAPSTCRPRFAASARRGRPRRRSRSSPTRISPRTSARGRSRRAAWSQRASAGRTSGSTCMPLGRRSSAASRSRRSRAAAGRKRAARGGLARADALFRVDRAPWCPEIF